MLVLPRPSQTSPARPSGGVPSAAALPSDQNTTRLAATTSSRLQKTGRSRSRVACQRRSASRRRRGAEAFDDPVGQSEEPQLLGGRRIDGQPVGVVGMALGVADFFGVAVAPDGTLAQQPVRGEPRAASTRRPPCVAGEHDSRGEATDHLHRPPAMKSIDMNNGAR